MRRRTLLISIGLVVTTGCTDLEPEPTSTPTSTPTATPPSTPTATEVPDPPATDDPTQEQTESPTPSRAQVHIDRARAHLQEAYAGYVLQAPGSDSSILAIDASVSEFSAGAVQTHTNEALTDLNTGRDDAVERDLPVINDLEAIRVFLSNAATAQGQLVRARVELDRAIGSIDRDQFNGAATYTNAMAGRIDNVDEAIQAIQDRTNAERMNRLDGLTPELYAEKLAQLEEELAAFEALEQGLRAFTTGVNDYYDVLDEYDDDDDDDYEPFPTASFQTTSDEYNSVTMPSSLTTQFETLRCISDAYHTAAEAMNNAISAREDGDGDAAHSHEDDAEAALDNCN